MTFFIFFIFHDTIIHCTPHIVADSRRVHNICELFHKLPGRLILKKDVVPPRGIIITWAFIETNPDSLNVPQEVRWLENTCVQMFNDRWFNVILPLLECA